MADDINWGPTGELVYDRTYSRVKPDGTRETWPETVRRVVAGNLALVDARYHLPGEGEDLVRLMSEFRILPGGRHLWASGVKNAQHLFNCWVAGWTENPSDHFGFTFLRLMEGGGVGANYSNSHLRQYPPVPHDLLVHIVCDPEHPDYEEMKNSGILSTEYDPEWGGAYVIEDSREGWASALVDLIDTHYRDEVTHYQRVYDVSRVRPAGAKLKTFGGRASGPLPLSKMLVEVCNILSKLAYKGWSLDGISAMEIDHMIASCVVAGGVRRSARMSMMHWNDDQIHEFVSIKQDSGSHWTTNISVEVDQGFWDGVGTDWPHPHKAHGILQAISKGMILNGEPGFWDSSLSNKGEPNQVVCTNPCGEITLEPWEPCNLGHVNLAAFVEDNGATDMRGLRLAHKLMTRFLIRATFSPVADPKSREVLDRNRRIGVGHFGVASYLALSKQKYSDIAGTNGHGFRYLLRELAADVDREAAKFCHNLRIPVPVKKRTVAPTGTIAKMPGVSEGIHPIFSKYFNRRIRFNTTGQDMDQLLNLEQKGYHIEKDLVAPNTFVVTIPTKDSLVEQVTYLHGEAAEEYVEAADELTLNELLSFQAVYQMCWADNAVSFTANIQRELPGDHYAQWLAGEVADQLKKFGGLLKGATIFPEMSMPQAPYERITKEEYDAALVSAVEDGVDLDCASGACPIR